MVKALLSVFCAATLISCIDEPKTYQVTIEVHYPSRIDTLTIEGQSRRYPEIDSRRGSNYIYGFYETSAPIKIIKIVEK